MNRVSCKPATIADFIEVIDKLNVCCPILSVQIQAVMKGSCKEVEKLLRENADPDQSNYVSKKNINIIIYITRECTSVVQLDPSDVFKSKRRCRDNQATITT